MYDSLYQEYFGEYDRLAEYNKDKRAHSFPRGTINSTRYLETTSAA